MLALHESRVRSGARRRRPRSSTPVITPDEARACRALVDQVRVAPEVREYIAAITRATRDDPSLALGASPRASVALMRAARARRRHRRPRLRHARRREGARDRGAPASRDARAGARGRRPDDGRGAGRGADANGGAGVNGFDARARVDSARRPFVGVFPTRRLAAVVLARRVLWLHPGTRSSRCRDRQSIVIVVAVVVRLSAPAAPSRHHRRAHVARHARTRRRRRASRTRFAPTWPWPSRVRAVRRAAGGVATRCRRRARAIPPFARGRSNDVTMPVTGDARGWQRSARSRFGCTTPLGLLARIVRASRPTSDGRWSVPSLTNVRRFRLLVDAASVERCRRARAQAARRGQRVRRTARVRAGRRSATGRLEGDGASSASDHARAHGRALADRHVADRLRPRDDAAGRPILALRARAVGGAGAERRRGHGGDRVGLHRVRRCRFARYVPPQRGAARVARRCARR